MTAALSTPAVQIVLAAVVLLTVVCFVSITIAPLLGPEDPPERRIVH